MRQFIFATAVLMSTIVGVGMFALPYAGAQSGFLIGAVFLFVLTAIMTMLHLSYGEIVSRTKEKHRLVGYAGLYLRSWGRGVIGSSRIVALYGSLLAYIIVGGGFLYTMLSFFINEYSIVFNLIFFAVGAIAVYFGLKLISELDLLMGLFLIIIVFLFFYFGLPKIDFNNLKVINWQNTLIPYGAILYSLAGTAAIPELREIFTKNKKGFKKAIILGTIMPAILYFVFMGVIIGLTGLETSSEAITGLIGILGQKVVFLGSLFGFLACLTSFFILGLSLKKTFWYDFKINKNIAWLMTCSVPLILFLLGIRSFVSIIIFIGALAGLIEGTAIVLIHKKAKTLGDQVPDYSFRIPDFLRYIVIFIFIVGFAFTLISLL